ncbi:MAG: glycosyltransferase family 2 protein [Chthonomonas sp.]|nr:glycosyltransferase family 2 protein [Chthonomonas sp.]
MADGEIPQTSLSVLIVNWNTREWLVRCIDSIHRFPPGVPYEIIVVDNASSDGSAEAVREMGITLRAEQTNHGYARGNNLAFQVARGDWLLTLNPDTEVTEGALDTALERLRNHPKHACLGAKLIDPEPPYASQRSVRGFPSVLGILGMLTGLDKRFPRGTLGSYSLPGFDYELEQNAPQPMGTFLLFRRAALATIGDPTSPFDERFPIFFNEVDLLARLAKNGWSTLYCPEVQIVHLGGASTRQARPQMIWESHRSLIRYLVKHTRRTARLLLPGLALVIWLGAWVRARSYHRGFRA